MNDNQGHCHLSYIVRGFRLGSISIVYVPRIFEHPELKLGVEYGIDARLDG